MRVYFLLLALLLPHLVYSQSYINKVFARRARSSQKYVSSPRQLRYSRYIQEPPVQQKNTDEIDIDSGLEQQFADYNNFDQGQEKSTKSASSYTQTPIFFETSTARPVQQVKSTGDEQELELAQNDLNQPQSQVQQAELQSTYDSSSALDGYGGSTKQTAEGGDSQSNTPLTESLPVDRDEFNFEEEHNSVDWLRNSIRGEPGKDFPVYSSVPETGFQCSQQQYPGYYADVQAQCQAFHICQPDGRSNAFLCPNGTIFSQRHFVCVWWFEFDCSTAEQFYHLNSELYKVDDSSFGGGANGGGRVSDNGATIGGSVPSNLNGHQTTGKLSSPKENLNNLNKLYMAQIDDFGTGVVTTSTPTYTTNSKPSYNNGGALRTSTFPVQYGVNSVESVTPSVIESKNYETTPYNLDEALGEEIHSETPLIESLSLTTNIPQMRGLQNTYDSVKANNGNGYYNKPTHDISDYGYANNRPTPSYGSSSSNALKGASKSSQTKPVSSFPDSPVKNGRNGGSIKSKMYSNGQQQLKSNNGHASPFKGYSAYGGGGGGLKQ